MKDPTSQKLICIVDDDRQLVHALSLRCRQIGLRVGQAYDSVTALLQIHTHLPDFICLDVNLPGGSGLSLCEMLCSDDRTARIPKIVLTGRSDHDTIRRCHMMCAYYVEKSTDVWDRMGPLLHELLGEEPPGKL
ncbi:MAG TPA: response regulator [Pirellulales bacterium]|jgi:DNA-binding response OmpR family regulator|nr:response regulator [Pirellulales bacterium]